MSLEATQEQSAPTEELVTQEQATDEVVVDQAAAPADEADAAFEQGFDSARGIEAEPEPETPRIAGYTEDELRELLEDAKEVRKLREREAKVFGTLGSLKQAVDQLRQQAPAAPAAVAITGQLKRLSAEYPEMAEMLTEDLKDALGSGSARVDTTSVERVVGERLEQTSRTYEQKLLSVMHPDWRNVATSQEFAQWKGTLPPDELQVAESSWDALSVSEVLTKFKQWQRDATQSKQTRQARLEAAVAPKSNRAMPTGGATDEDAFVAGFKRARGIG